jgi:hypothetical protein
MSRHVDWSRISSIPGIEKGFMSFAPEDFVPDGSNGATFTDDTGTDGQQQFNTLYFNGAEDALAFLNFEIPDDYYTNPKLKLKWYTADTSGTAVAWSAKIRSIHPNDAAVMDVVGNVVTNVIETAKGTANYLCESILDLSTATVVIEPEDLTTTQFQCIL